MFRDGARYHLPGTRCHLAPHPPHPTPPYPMPYTHAHPALNPRTPSPPPVPSRSFLTCKTTPSQQVHGARVSALLPSGGGPAPGADEQDHRGRAPEREDDHQAQGPSGSSSREGGLFCRGGGRGCARFVVHFDAGRRCGLAAITRTTTEKKVSLENFEQYVPKIWFAVLNT